MSWVKMEKSIEGYELECMMKVQTLVKKVIRPLTEKEWAEMLNNHIPGYMMKNAIEYAIDEQGKREDFKPQIISTTTSTSNSIEEER